MSRTQLGHQTTQKRNCGCCPYHHSASGPRKTKYTVLGCSSMNGMSESRLFLVLFSALKMAKCISGHKVSKAVTEIRLNSAHILNFCHPIHHCHAIHSHLPDRICVLASLGCTLVNRLLSLLLQAVDSHTAIVEAHCHQVGMLCMNVEAHDTRTGGVDVLWEGRVFQRVEEKHATSLSTEVVWPREGHK